MRSWIVVHHTLDKAKGIPEHVPADRSRAVAIPAFLQASNSVDLLQDAAQPGLLRIAKVSPGWPTDGLYPVIIPVSSVRAWPFCKGSNCCVFMHGAEPELLRITEGLSRMHLLATLTSLEPGGLAVSR
jgi:hypothetical protein